MHNFISYAKNLQQILSIDKKPIAFLLGAGCPLAVNLSEDDWPLIAETLARVREKSLELIESMDSDTYKGLEKSFTKWLELMIGERFSSVDMENDLPVAYKTDNATSLTYDMLSHGTKDTVAIAWRFALCEKFLTNGSGLLFWTIPW